VTGGACCFYVVRFQPNNAKQAPPVVVLVVVVVFFVAKANMAAVLPSASGFVKTAALPLHRPVEPPRHRFASAMIHQSERPRVDGWWDGRYKARDSSIPPTITQESSMSVERTFSIIKPDATRRNLTGAINKKLEEAGLRIVAQKRVQLTEAQAKGFYAVHAERPFYGELVSFMISGPVVVQVLEGENAVARNREVMGATNPANAAEGTIRKEFAESIEANSVHGSDSLENAAIEIAFFFAQSDIVG